MKNSAQAKLPAPPVTITATVIAATVIAECLDELWPGGQPPARPAGGAADRALAGRGERPELLAAGRDGGFDAAPADAPAAGSG
ncbi:MAG: hypothetical protein ACO4CG_14440, partial [Prochlorothrix sp.]